MILGWRRNLQNKKETAIRNGTRRESHLIDIVFRIPHRQLSPYHSAVQLRKIADIASGRFTVCHQVKCDLRTDAANHAGVESPVGGSVPGQKRKPADAGIPDGGN